ncbi:hypothetical protein QBC45DRAFT_486313 [Copromyces sp. CBS 386.78]|nr:hypothetical protein QBC45DRAFT_486313 [Copromyces sp. CBS 386.78]
MKTSRCMICQLRDWVLETGARKKAALAAKSYCWTVLEQKHRKQRRKNTEKNNNNHNHNDINNNGSRSARRASSDQLYGEVLQMLPTEEFNRYVKGRPTSMISHEPKGGTYTKPEREHLVNNNNMTDQDWTAVCTTMIACESMPDLSPSFSISGPSSGWGKCFETQRLRLGAQFLPCPSSVLDMQSSTGADLHETILRRTGVARTCLKPTEEVTVATLIVAMSCAAFTFPLIGKIWVMAS